MFGYSGCVDLGELSPGAGRDMPGGLRQQGVWGQRESRRVGVEGAGGKQEMNSRHVQAEG